jgi:lipid II:glycine glycyltransferase (peptidoglycan interpeptide bridge formation enzyme)
MLGRRFVKMEKRENNTNQNYDNNTANYSAEFDCFEENEWYHIISKFEDANIFQTWAYGLIICGRENVSHFVLKKNGKVVAAAQVRIYRLPVIKKSIGYIRWGPLWRSMCSEEADPTIFRQAIRALRNEYVMRRGLILRLRPALFKNDSDDLLSIFKEEGYILVGDAEVDRTLVMDLRPPLQEVRRDIKERWRSYLSRAERENFEVSEGCGDDLFKSFIEIYGEMLNRKKFIQTNDINEFRSIQKELPDAFKMKIMLSRSNGKITNGLICSGIGNTGVYLFGATSDAGLKNRGAYLLQWRMIEWLKKNERSYYDLNGINPKTNPGTYQFKTGLCGRNGKDVYFLGQFDAYPDELFRYLMHWGDGLRRFWRRGSIFRHFYVSLNKCETN